MSEPVTSAAPVEPYVSHIDRRTALAWIGAMAVAAGVGPAATAAPLAKGYGTDPNLQHPVVPWPRTMTPEQLQTAAIVCDFILPATADAPSASAVGVPDFLDEWISAPYPDQQKHRPIILAGLKRVEVESRRRHGVDLMHAEPVDREALLQGLTMKSTDPSAAAPHIFFRLIRGLTAGAYYTTKPGFKDIGYIGNVPLKTYPGPSPEVLAVLDARLKQLGI